MAVNQVIYDGETLIDLTGDTVTEDTLLSGATAHDAAGRSITGTVTPGDMFKSTYDTDNNGQVDAADNADKVGGRSLVVSSTAPTTNDTSVITIVI